MALLGQVVTASGGSEELLSMLVAIGISSVSSVTHFADDPSEFATNVISLVGMDGLARMTVSDERALSSVWTIAKAQSTALHGTRAGSSI